MPPVKGDTPPFAAATLFSGNKAKQIIPLEVRDFLLNNLQRRQLFV
jgi:hypothetical protein